LKLFKLLPYYFSLFSLFKQYWPIPIKIRIKNIVEAKLNGKNNFVNQKIPIKAKSKKFKKKKLGLIYFLVISEFLGKLNNITTKSGVKLRR